jgi:hypothetical protein
LNAACAWDGARSEVLDFATLDHWLEELIMVLGIFSLSAYTILHVIICFIAIGTGLVIVLGMLANKRLDGWTFWFLLFTALTNLTGFGFPFDHLLPSHFLGIFSMLATLAAIIARYMFDMQSVWRSLYAIAATIALWTNTFALVAQSFGKIPALNALAPTQSEPPFLIAELVMLIVFVVLGIAAVRQFHPVAT